MFCPLPRGAPVLLCLAFCTFATMSPALEVPPALALVHQGADLLRRGRFEEALSRFESAARLDARDGQARFLAGVAHNRLGRHRQARNRLAESSALGYVSAEIGFERGYSYLGLEQWEDAVAALSEYERTRPGRGQTMEFLGRAALGLRLYDSAENALREALRRDPRLRDSILFHLARVEHARRREDRSRSYLTSLVREIPESPLARYVASKKDAVDALARPQAGRRQRVRTSATLLAGHNSNVIGVGNAIPVPPDITRKGAGYSLLAVDTTGQLLEEPGRRCSTGYTFAGVSYGSTPAADLDSHTVFLDHVVDLDPGITLSGRVADEFTVLGGEDFRNQLRVRLGAIRRHSARSSSELAYEFSESGYFFPATAVQNRDSHSHAVWFNHSRELPRARILLRFSFAHLWNEARGSDFDYESDALAIGLRRLLFEKVTVDCSYTRSFDEYENLNSLAGATGFAFRRDDDGHQFQVTLTRPLVERSLVFAQYGRRRGASNVAFYDFVQHVSNVGLQVQF